jgi:hypothetical protein
MSHHVKTSRPRRRRGNIMVLAAAILALLAVIAAAFITRAQGGRVTAVAVRSSVEVTDRSQMVGSMLAQEISDALFVWPIDIPVFGTPPNARDSNRLRLTPRRGQQLLGDQVGFRYSVDPRFTFNFAPHEVVPWTNWPDELLGIATGVWPQGPGAPAGTSTMRESNPLGGPGFGDSRWLRDTEPLRWSTNTGVVSSRHDAFKYWRHMTNISRPNNGWRVCKDISDVTNTTGSGGVVTNLGVPIEQWVLDLTGAGHTALNARINPGTGDAIFQGEVPFMNRWANWFNNDINIHGLVYRDPNPVNHFSVPLNLYNLKNVDGGIDDDGDGFLIDWYEKPQADFIGGTARWNIGRVLADTDGDGFTDACWFLAPTPVDNGIRTVVAVSIVDNGGLLNANVATRFSPFSTAGETPADLALVGEGNDDDDIDDPPIAWNVGFLDEFQNRGAAALIDYPINIPQMYGGAAPAMLWGNGFWTDFLVATGVWNRMDFDDELLDPFERRLYWLYSGRRPFEASFGLTPFSLADEYELRMYHGQNNPRIFSRFERAFTAIDTSEQFQTLDAVRWDPFRSDRWFRETSAMLAEPQTDLSNTTGSGQLNNPELLHDNRRKLTVHNGARNDLLPPWLRWRWEDNPATPPFEDLPTRIRDDAVAFPDDLDNNGRSDVIDRFYEQALRKADLREPEPDPFVYVPPVGEQRLHERLPWLIMHALTEGRVSGVPPIGTGQSFFGDYDVMPSHANLVKLRELAAGFTANILAYRDRDDFAPLFDDPATQLVEVGPVPLPEWGRAPEDETRRHLGMERQPFITEAFIGHVYLSSGTVPANPLSPPNPQFHKVGDNYVVDGDPSTVVAVQIANPYVRDFNDPEYAIDLSNYQLRVAGKTVSLTGLLPPSTEELPSTATFYSIEPGFGPNDFTGRWLDFFDLTTLERPTDSLLVNVRNLVGTPWSNDRDDYEGFGPDDSPIELIRIDFTGGVNNGVVIDRIDEPFDPDDPDPEPRLGEMLEDLDRPPASGADQVTGVFEGIRIGANDAWTTWCRVARPWGHDYDFSVADNTTWGIGPEERSPRFVFGKQKVSEPDPAIQQDGGAGETYVGSDFTLAANPDTPWFDLEHQSPAWTALLGSVPRRKPTFFNLHPVYIAGGVDQYPDFEDTVLGYGTSFYGLQLATTNAPIPDKGVYYDELEFPMQMLQKDGDFQQVGELLNVFLYGHELAFTGGTPGTYERTETTFSERLARELDEPGTLRLFVGRLGAHGYGELIGDAASTIDLADRYHAVPDLPAGIRLLDAFVCDGVGTDFNPATDDPAFFLYRNAAGFTGKATPGLVNINTAPVEVLRTLPHWSRLVHRDPQWDGFQRARLPRTAVAEATVSYRERFRNGDIATLDDVEYLNGADYSDRSAVSSGLREGRGFVSVGELRLLNEPGCLGCTAEVLTDPELDFELFKDPTAWSMSFAATAPFDLLDDDPDAIKYGAHVSTDVNGPNDLDTFTGDRVSGDVEEANLLFAGASNLVTTRSDVFTVYFRVRNFRQNPVTGRWDATNPEYIVDDARYVMLVDRSEVDDPSDQPKILYLDKLEN